MDQTMKQTQSSDRAAGPEDGKRIAFIRANWHRDIVDQAWLGFRETAAELGIAETAIDLFDVPGSLEIPLQAQMLARSGGYDVIVAAGLVVDGGIYRHDFVAGTVIDALMRVQLDCNLPVLSVVLTPHHFQETEAHRRFFFDHFRIKGAEAARACAATLANLRRIAEVSGDKAA